MNQQLLRNLVEIKWLDSKAAPNIWEYLDDLDALKPVEISSTGYLIDNNTEYKTIVQSLSETQILGRISIPVCSIISIVDVRAGKFIYHGKSGG